MAQLYIKNADRLRIKIASIKWKFLRHKNMNRIETKWNGSLLNELLPHQISRQNIKKCVSY